MKKILFKGKWHQVDMEYKKPFAIARTINGPKIVGIQPNIPYTPETMEELLREWSIVYELQEEPKKWKLSSTTRKGVTYTIVKMGDSWFCNCPARTECKHIKFLKVWERV